jgi:hypothetical protein
MSKHFRRLRPACRKVLFLLCAILGASQMMRGAGLSADDQQFLSAYVHVHDALIAKDLPGVIVAAKTMPDNIGAGLAKAASLGAARDEFSRLTPRAEKLAAGQPGYHVFYCPMAQKDWVQTSPAVANPYLGEDMLTCGVEKH